MMTVTYRAERSFEACRNIRKTAFQPTASCCLARRLIGRRCVGAWKPFLVQLVVTVVPLFLLKLVVVRNNRFECCLVSGSKQRLLNLQQKFKTFFRRRLQLCSFLEIVPCDELNDVCLVCNSRSHRDGERLPPVGIHLNAPPVLLDACDGTLGIEIFKSYKG